MVNIGLGSGLLLAQHHTIIWTYPALLPFESSGINFSEIFIKIQSFPLKKMHLKMSSATWWPFCPGLHLLMKHQNGFHASGLLEKLTLWLKQGQLFLINIFYKKEQS